MFMSKVQMIGLGFLLGFAAALVTNMVLDEVADSVRPCQTYQDNER